ncbi:MAG TPA: T9SS type A sorting domain-containing protein [Calditrichaeota bacterium]|nr:T9SS type A sorting domain-containing protein [Calditrichota bacterium]
MVGSENTIPKSFALKQNFPNPFNPGTQIVFHLPKRSHVKLTVYNMAGQLVATIVNQVMEPGVKQINFNASSLPSGVYFYRIQASEYSDTRKMVLLK